MALAGSVHDDDSTTALLIKKYFPDMKSFKYQGHTKTAMGRLIRKLIGVRVAYGGVATRISKWWMALVMKACKLIRNGTHSYAEAAVNFRFEWSHTSRHYSQEYCALTCPCKEKQTLELGSEEIAGLDQQCGASILEEEQASVEIGSKSEEREAEDEAKADAEAEATRAAVAAVSPSATPTEVGMLDPEKVWTTNDWTKIFLHPSDKKTRLLSQVVSKMSIKAPEYVHEGSSTAAESCHHARASRSHKSTVVGNARWKGMCARTVIHLSLGASGLVRIAKELGARVTPAMAAAWASIDLKRNAARAKAATEEAKKKVYASNASASERRSKANAAFQEAKKVPGAVPVGGAKYKAKCSKTAFDISEFGRPAKKPRRARRSQQEMGEAHASGDTSIRKCECGRFYTAKASLCAKCKKNDKP
jgi:hypothetical protein